MKREQAKKDRIEKEERITRERIEEKAIEIYNLSYYTSFHPKQIAECLREFLKEFNLKLGNVRQVRK